MRGAGLVLVTACVLVACDNRPTGGDGAVDAGPALDAGRVDASTTPTDAGRGDGGVLDGATPSDGGSGRLDGATGADAGGGDAGSSGGTDAGPPDSGSPDGGPPDSGLPDTGPPDAGSTGGCISGATGTHAVRFRWAGSGSGSIAYVVYEENDLPDTSRWHVGAYSMSFSYTPRFVDTFLGDGGLDLGGTVFIDVELSTAGLSTIRDVTIAVRGRSYNTTTSGSFTWQTFDGTGASPYGGVYNSAPYQWYPADATAAFTPGNSGVLLRLRAGPPSNNLVVNAVEICFDAS